MIRLLFGALRRACGLLLLLGLPLAAAAQTQLALPVGKGSFAYVDTASGTAKALTIWYYKPAVLKATSRVLFVMHGANRNGDVYRDHWQRYAEKYNFLLVVPEFSKQDFSEADYQFGNVRDPDRSRWNFFIIERIFDQVRANESLSASHYDLYGHSAGAQFVHRFMLFMPAPRVATAIAANAGTYTLPRYPDAQQPGFPWSLDTALVDTAGLKADFSRRLIVMLGEQDTDPQHPQLSKKKEAMAQGRFRYERGQYFYRIAQEQASVLQTPLAWQLIGVPGVAHSDSGMAKAAARVLYEGAP